MLLLKLLAVHLLSSFATTPRDGGADLSAEIHNVTDAAVEVWVNDQFCGSVASRSTSMATVTVGVGNDANQIAVTGISELQGAYRLNAAVVALGPEARIEVVWGGVTAPKDLAKTDADVATPGRFADLFNERWKTLHEYEAGQPFRMRDTLLGTKWKGRAVRGEALTVHWGDSSLLVNSAGMLMVKVPKGQFNIAQVGGAAGRSVTISRDFYMAVTETTRAQWSLIMDRELDRSADEMPAVMLTWDQAVDFCARLPAAKGWSYRLPTEAQWEYACSGGKAGPFHPGGVSISKVMWYSGNSGMKAHPVGQLLPNTRGIYDMHGNVREWCRDWWHPVPSVGADPTGPANGTERVRRGGAFDVPQQWCSCGARDAGPPDIPQAWLGFRVVLEPE